MRIGYCSPFNPMRSGISDFSEELVAELKKHMEVVIISPVEPSNTIIREQFEWHYITDLDEISFRNSLDMVVYHMGNNERFHGKIAEAAQKYPGIVELHEIGLHHLAAEMFWVKKGPEAYKDMAEYCHGARGKKIAAAFLDGRAGAPWEEHALDMTMNRYILENAMGVIVHSEAVKQMVLGEKEDVPIANILLHDSDVNCKVPDRKICRKKIGIPEDSCIFGAFGFATRAKRIIPELDALKRLQETTNREYRFLIVGQPQEELHLEEEIAQRGLRDQVIVTGFTSLEDFKTYMGACDFCLNLRYPTQGESSASLHRMLGMGKPAIVTDVGTFSDYPDDVVIKVRCDAHEIDDIYAAIRLLSDNQKELVRRSEAAVRFAKENCDIRKNAQRYAAFFEQVSTNTWQPDYEDVMIGRLCDLGLTGNSYLKHIWDSLQTIVERS